MNERIRQLAKDAGIKLTPAQFSGVLEDEVDEFTLEKFAQLIIDHATECVRDVLRDEESDLTYAAAGQVQNRIKQFFGVEL